MEKQMTEIYTRKIFLKFQDELWNSLVIMPQFVLENATHKMYVVESSPKERVHRVREIAYDKELDFASCTCKKFESEGLPCKHILAFLRLFGNIPLPNQYIMKRWTRGAKCQIITDKQGVEIGGQRSSMLTWRAKLFQLASKVIDKAIIYEKASVIVNDGFQSLLGKIESIVSNTKSGGISEKGSTAHDYKALKDPYAVRAKGCGQRLKRGKEKATNATKYRGRRCNECGKIGQSHDKRNCPLLNNLSSQNEESPQHTSEYDSKADSLSSTGLHEKMKG
ncbi:protein FAR1-RELATED SEQUENCE 9-like [Ziziphus jujuba]|uniref:Protein FAR1-RELATED SEQUENCE n=1 Tax=Ziziphus jujuba TaxID=326968 RepID=A0A6P4ASX4_ZIZJJ|nr:protein FAR1-RELATED SEQUENCE 9-like [Ziziphus jujuba]